MKTLTWLCNSRSCVRLFLASVQDDIGFALYLAQLGDLSPKAKPLQGLGTGVIEIIRQRLKQLRSEVKNAQNKTT